MTRTILDVKDFWSGPGTGSGSMAAGLSHSLRSWGLPVTGTGSVLPWTRAVIRRSRKCFVRCMKRAGSIKAAASSTGVPYAILPSQTRRWSTRSRQGTSGISSIPWWMRTDSPARQSSWSLRRPVRRPC